MGRYWHAFRPRNPSSDLLRQVFLAQFLKENISALVSGKTVSGKTGEYFLLSNASQLKLVRSSSTWLFTPSLHTIPRQPDQGSHALGELLLFMRMSGLTHASASLVHTLLHATC